MKKFSDIVTETILEKETQAKVNALITEGIVDGLKKIAGAGKDKLNSFKTTFAAKSKEYLTKTLSSAVKLLISSITSKKQVNIKSELEQNALFKEVLGETNAIEEVTSEFNKDAVKDVIGKKGEVISDSINQPITKNIITEDAFDSADTITTKIFSSVYKVISGALEKAGYIIKPEFRNWYDKCVRKVQKKFYASNLGKQIKDLPPEVEQDVMERFQAIIGIIVVVVMIWVISSSLSGNDITTAAAGGAAAETLDDTADAADAADDANSLDDVNNSNSTSDTTSNAGGASDDVQTAATATSNAGSTKFYKVPGGKDLDNVSIKYMEEPEEISDFRKKYIDDRFNALQEANPNLSSSALRAAKSKLGMEFDYAYANGKVLTISNGNITPIESSQIIDSLDNPAEFLKSAGALDGKSANLDVINGLDDKFNAGQLAEAGIENISFNAYGIPVKIDLTKIPDADKDLNPAQLAEKYVKEVAQRAAKANQTEEELGI